MFFRLLSLCMIVVALKMPAVSVPFYRDFVDSWDFPNLFGYFYAKLAKEPDMELQCGASSMRNKRITVVKREDIIF